mgnify:CR=1 FL=1
MAIVTLVAVVLSAWTMSMLPSHSTSMPVLGSSHVNDSGFWLVGKFLGLSVGETLKTWTVQETIIGVLGLVFVVCIAALYGVL